MTSVHDMSSHLVAGKQVGYAITEVRGVLHTDESDGIIVIAKPQ